MKVLVTGAAGALGRNLIENLKTIDLYRKSVIFNGTYLIQTVP